MATNKRPKVVVFGTMCRDPVAGMVWLYLQHLLGLEQLGYETYYVEWHGRWVPNPMDASEDAHVPRVLIGDVMRRFSLADRWICRADHLGEGRTFGGLPPEKLPRLYTEAEAIINVTGSHFIEDEQLACPRRVYLETDPGIPQVKLHAGNPDTWRLVRGHTHNFTWAQNFAHPDCLLPATDLQYWPTRQPVVPELWEGINGASRGRFTTIAKWRKKGKDIEFAGDLYRWSKDLEFLKVLQLPQRSAQPLELALSGIDPDDRTMLTRYGWRVVDAVPVSSSLGNYRRYIQDSRGEFSIVKDQYRRLRTGWFSDRSVCYLAAGRPVVLQDTGFSNVLPTGEGLFTFQTVDDILAAFAAIASDYARHSRAAREIAHEYFDARKVMGDLLEKIGLDRQIGG